MVSQIVADCYAEFPRDFVGLWQISDAVQRDRAEADWQEVRDTALQVVARLLADPRVHAGQFNSKVRGLAHWPLTAQETLRRIAMEWSELAQNPNINDICWFDQD